MIRSNPADGRTPALPTPVDSTARLLAEARTGDAEARDRLLRRYLPGLTRWARGRLPAHARSAMETDDLVQITLVRALDHLETFAPARQGAFLAYLRRILVNEIRDEIRRTARRPAGPTDVGKVADAARSPLEEAIAAETLDRYEAALDRLTPEQQEAVILRLELGMPYEEIAFALGRASANAARMSVTRGLVRLVERMQDFHPGPRT